MEVVMTIIFSAAFNFCWNGVDDALLASENKSVKAKLDMLLLWVFGQDLWNCAWWCQPSSYTFYLVWWPLIILKVTRELVVQSENTYLECHIEHSHNMEGWPFCSRLCTHPKIFPESKFCAASTKSFRWDCKLRSPMRKDDIHMLKIL